MILNVYNILCTDYNVPGVFAQILQMLFFVTLLYDWVILELQRGFSDSKFEECGN